MARREPEHRAGVDAAAQVAADGDVGAQPDADGFVERATERLDVLVVRSVGNGGRVVEVPVADHADLPAPHEEVVARRYLLYAGEERTILNRGHQTVRLVERLRVPAGR